MTTYSCIIYVFRIKILKEKAMEAFGLVQLGHVTLPSPILVAQGPLGSMTDPTWVTLSPL